MPGFRELSANVKLLPYRTMNDPSKLCNTPGTAVGATSEWSTERAHGSCCTVPAREGWGSVGGKDEKAQQPALYTCYGDAPRLEMDEQPARAQHQQGHDIQAIEPHRNHSAPQPQSCGLLGVGLEPAVQEIGHDAGNKGNWTSYWTSPVGGVGRCPCLRH